MGKPVQNKVKEKNKFFFVLIIYPLLHYSNTPLFHVDYTNPLTLKVL